MMSSDRTPSEPSSEFLELHDDPEQIRAAEGKLLEEISRFDYPGAAVFAIRLAFEEAVLNALRHGHKELPGVPVRVRWEVTPDRLTIQVEDQGPGFDAAALPDPTDPDRLEQPHGRGVMLIHAYMTSVTYNDRGNAVTMVYEKPNAG